MYVYSSNRENNKWFKQERNVIDLLCLKSTLWCYPVDFQKRWKLHLRKLLGRCYNGLERNYESEREGTGSGDVKGENRFEKHMEMQRVWFKDSRDVRNEGGGEVKMAFWCLCWVCEDVERLWQEDGSKMDLEVLLS